MPAFATRILSAVLLLPLLLVSWACNQTEPDEGESLVQGDVRNVSTHIGGARLEFVDDAGVDFGFAVSNPFNGDYSISLPPGTYTVTILAAGYATQTHTIVLDGSCCGGLIPPTFDFDYVLEGPAQVEGAIVSSQTGVGVADAGVTFHAQTCITGVCDTVAFGATTDAQGRFTIPGSPEGLFAMRVAADGYLPYERRDVQITPGAFVIDPLTLVETPPAGSVRIVVTWGDAPSDLDSHLTGPDGMGGRFHVYYADTQPTDAGASLDLDDTNGNGPETTTITTPRSGTYRFSVYNYSDSSTNGSSGIAASPTRVEVYTSAGLARSYTAPTATPGNTWRVFEATIGGALPQFNDNDGASLGYRQVTAVGDFLTSGGGALPTKHVN